MCTELPVSAQEAFPRNIFFPVAGFRRPSLPPADRYTSEFVLSEAEKGNRDSLNKHLNKQSNADVEPARPCPIV